MLSKIIVWILYNPNYIIATISSAIGLQIIISLVSNAFESKKVYWITNLPTLLTVLVTLVVSIYLVLPIANLDLGTIRIKASDLSTAILFIGSLLTLVLCRINIAIRCPIYNKTKK